MLWDKAVQAHVRAGLNFDVYGIKNYSMHALQKWKPHQGVGISNSGSYHRHTERNEKSLGYALHRGKVYKKVASSKSNSKYFN